MRRIRPLREGDRERELVWYLPVSGPPINGKTFPGCFQQRARVSSRNNARRPLRFPKGNAPFRFRAAALFSRGGSENCLCISESLIARARARAPPPPPPPPSRVGLRPWIILIGISWRSQDSFAPRLSTPFLEGAANSQHCVRIYFSHCYASQIYYHSCTLRRYLKIHFCGI